MSPRVFVEFSATRVATLPSPQRSSWALRPKVGNGVDNEFPGPSGPGAQKVKNGVEKDFQLRFQLWARRAQELLWGGWKGRKTRG